LGGQAGQHEQQRLSAALSRAEAELERLREEIAKQPAQSAGAAASSSSSDAAQMRMLQRLDRENKKYNASVVQKTMEVLGNIIERTGSATSPMAVLPPPPGGQRTGTLSAHAQISQREGNKTTRLEPRSWRAIQPVHERQTYMNEGKQLLLLIDNQSLLSCPVLSCPALPCLHTDARSPTGGRRTERSGAVSRRHHSPRRSGMPASLPQQVASGQEVGSLGANASAAATDLDATTQLTHADILNRVCAQLDLSNPKELIPFSIRVSNLLTFGNKLQSFVHEVGALPCPAHLRRRRPCLFPSVRLACPPLVRRRAETLTSYCCCVCCCWCCGRCCCAGAGVSGWRVGRGRAAEAARATRDGGAASPVAGVRTEGSRAGLAPTELSAHCGAWLGRLVRGR
jgi:hypothetical protein